ncbi:hypothetical protein A9Q84_04780 [Halobacteriovorax marinus]|uniref:Response regulator n=1 Tax=Halobacteriovorax marinus TaxID=97084 RepID=A0A1Y5FAU5_9BACT|nr:hypothetical protein A9Q84_04780 [Halobacteriovorax marinus]
MENQEQKQILEDFACRYNLTPRESQIVGQLLMQMTSTRQISESLGISTSTVRNHFEHIFKKTNCDNKCEVAVLIYKALLEELKSFKFLNRTPKVLVVDDNSVMCEVLASSIEKYGIKATTLTNPEKVFDLLEVERFDCIISDIRMPGMDGVELLEKVRTVHPFWPFVILISGHHDYDLDELLNFGAVAFVQKPFKADEIYQLISNYYVDDLVQRNRLMLMDKEVSDCFNKDIIDLATVSVGTGGAFISFDEIPTLVKANVGKFYDFNVKVDEHSEVVKIVAEVVWKRSPNEENAGLGIRFLTLTPGLDKYIKKHITQNKISSFIPNL